MAGYGLRALVLIVALASFCAMVARATEYDGLPRPRGYPDNPTAAYGTYPEVYIRVTGSQIANCAWYGFANAGFPAAIQEQCLTYLRSYVVGLANGRSLRPYRMITSRGSACYDSVNGYSYGYHGCYYLENGTFVIPPISDPLAATPPPPSAVPAPPALLLPPPGTPPALLPPPGTPAFLPPPDTPAELWPPPDIGVDQPPPVDMISAGSSSLLTHAYSAALLAVCAAAVNLVIRP